MKRLKYVSLICLALVVIAAGLGVAQDEAVTLRHKFTAGEKATYVTKISGTVPMTVTVPAEMGGGALPLDVIVDMAMTTDELTREVDDKGFGHLDKTIPELAIRSSMQVMGMPLETVLKWEKAALTATVNNEPLPADDGQKKLADMLAQTVKMIMEPTGKSTPEAETAQETAGALGITGLGGVDLSQLGALLTGLPEQAVKVGDTWEVKDEIKNGAATVTGSSTFKLAAIETVEGRRVARIEGQARLTMEGQMAAPGAMGMPMHLNITKMDVALSFINHFDIERGTTPLTEMNMCQNMDMVMSVPPGIAGAAGGGNGQPVNMPTTIENAQFAMETRRQPPPAQ